MSKFVDERVVEMSFDNKKFETNVKTSMDTINKLKDSLDFSGSAKNINRHLDGVNTNSLATGLSSINQGFSTLQIMGISAIANITSRLVDMGIELAKSLTGINELTAGWMKFQEVSTSEATLLAQGYEQAVVTKAIEDLLWFTDETSYSFTEMMNNMSKFTAAGVGLKEAQESMMGIANWAALSGQNAQTASRVMYQLSQAMGSGVIKLQDWKSIETANMATKEFKDMILETAVSMETLTRNVDGTFTTLTGKTFEGGQFRDFLSEGFLTSDVLTKTLEAYSSVATEIQKMMADDSSLTTASKALEIYEKQIIDLENSLSSLSDEERLLTEQRIAEMKFGIKAFKAAQEARTLTDAINSVKDAVSTGWTKIFRSIFGGVDEAKKLWTDLANSLYDIFMDGMWKKIDVLDIWTELGGRDDLWANTEETTGAFWNLFNALVAIKDLVSGAWTKVFGFSQLEDYDENVSEIGNKLKNFTENLREWSAGLVMSEKTTEALTDVLTGLFSIVKIGGKLLGAFWKGIQPLVKVVSSFATILVGAFGKVGKVLTDFSNTTTIFDKIANGMQKFFNAIINFVKSLNLLNGIKTFIDAFTISLKKTTGVTGDFVKNQSIFKTILDGITGAFKWLGDILSRYVLPILPKVFEILGTGLGWIIGMISNLISGIGGLIKRFTEWASTSKTFQNGMTFLKKVLDSVGNAFKTLWVNIVGFFNSFGKVNTKPVEDFSDDVQTSLSPLQVFLEGLANLFKGLWNVVKAFIPAIGALFTFIGKALSAIGDKLKAIFTKDNGDVNFQKIFTVGFWALIIVGIKRFADMLRSITQVFTDAFDGVFDYFNSAAMKNYMEAIKTMAISILLMVGALLILGSMDEKVLIKSGIALTALIGLIVTVMKLMQSLVITNFEKTGKMLKGTTSSLGGLGFAFIGLGMAILLLATSLKMLSKLNPQEMMYSLGILAIMMVMLVTVMKAVGKAEKGTNKAVKSMVKVAISIALLARPLKKIGSIDTTTGIKGLIGIAALMTILVGYSAFSKPIEKSQKPINGLMTTAIALTILIIPLKVIGKMNWVPLVTTFGVITALFAIIAGISKILKKKDTDRLKVISGQLSLFALGLASFGFAMLILGLNSWNTIGKVGAVLGGVFTILVTASKLMKLKDANRLNSIAKSLTKFARSIGLMGISLMILGLNGWESIGRAMTALLGVFGLLVAMNKVLGKQLTKPRVDNMTKIVKSLIPMSIGLSMFGVSIAIIARNDWTAIGTAIGALASVLLILVGASSLINKLGSSAGQLSLLGLALITISIGLMAFSGALVMLGNMKLETIGKGLLAIVGIFAVLGIAGLLLKPIIPVLLMLSITFGIFAVGVFLLVTALSMLVGIMLISSTAFAAGLIAMSAAVITAAPMIMKALWVVIKGILDIIVQAVPLVVNAITQLLLEIIKAIEIIVPPLMAMIVNLLLEILSAVQIIVPQVIDLVITLLTEFLTKIQTIFPLITSTLMSLFLNVLDVLIENTPALVNKLVDLFIGLITTLRTRLPEILIELALFMADLVDGAVLAITELIPRMVNAGFDLMIGLLDGIGNTLVERAPEVREAIVNFAKNIWEAFLSFFGINSPSTKFIEAAGHMISGIIKGLWDGLTGLISEIGKWVGSVMSSIGGFFKDGWDKGKDLIKNIGDGAKSVWSGVSGWFSGTAKDIGNFFSNKASDLKQTGTNIIKNIGDGAKNAWNGTKTWFSNTASSVSGFFGDAVGSMKTAGSDLIGGLKNGLETAGNSIKETAKNVGGKVTGWFKDVFGIKSPSRVFAEMGRFLDLGLASGIENNSDVAYDAAGALADDTINGFERSGLAQVLQDLNGSLQSDFDNEIVIRPVLDLSEIQNGKNRLYSMMNDGSSYDISGSNNMAKSARDEMNSRNRSEKGSENNGNVSTTGNNTEIVNNTFNITGSSPKEIAEEVSRVIQNSVDRRKAKNGNFSF